MEYLSQYEYMITYIKGEDNTVTDVLSQLTEKEEAQIKVGAIFEIERDLRLYARIWKGYSKDKWCKVMLDDLKKGLVDPKLEISFRNGLLFVGKTLIVPKYKDLHKQLFRLAHDHLRHFRGEKSYGSLRDDFYWPNMRRDLINVYIPGCRACQQNKSNTTKAPGPLHPLPILDK